MTNIFQNVRTMRWIAAFVSLLFIPAFISGVASLWTPVFAITLAYYFRRRLIEIIETYKPYETEQARAIYVWKKLPLLTLECITFTALPQIVSLIFMPEHKSSFYGISKNSEFYTFVGEWITEASFSSLSLSQQIMFSAYILSVFVFFMLMFLAGKNFYKAVKATWLKKTLWVFKKSENIKYYKKAGSQYWSYDLMATFYAFFLGIFSIILYEKIQKFMTPGEEFSPDNFVFIILINMQPYLFCTLLSFIIIACRKAYGLDGKDVSYD